MENIKIDIDKKVLENINIDIDKEVLENIDIDEEILENIDKILNRLEFGISNRARGGRGSSPLWTDSVKRFLDTLPNYIHGRS